MAQTHCPLCGQPLAPEATTAATVDHYTILVHAACADGRGRVVVRWAQNDRIWVATGWVYHEGETLLTLRLATLGFLHIPRASILRRDPDTAYGQCEPATGPGTVVPLERRRGSALRGGDELAEEQELGRGE